MRTIFTYDHFIKYSKIHDLVVKPKVIRVIEFDDEDVEEFEKDMDEAHSTGQPVIPIVIDSFGGSVYGLNAMASSILNAKVPVATIVTGKAMSAGAALFGFGTEGYRYIDKHATLMIHDAAWVAHGKVEEIKADAAQLDFQNKTLYRRLAVHLGHKEDYFMKLIKEHSHADWFLTAQEAKKHRLANHIKVPEMNIHLSLDVSFG